MQISLMENRLEGKDVEIHLEESALKCILDIAYDPIYGARPLRRYLEKNLATQLSKLIISGELKDHSIVVLSAKDNKLIFDVKVGLSNPKKKQKKDFIPSPQGEMDIDED